MTQAQLIAGYLKLTSAHYHSSTPTGIFINLRSELAEEMDLRTLNIATNVASYLGGWYTGEAQLARS